MKRADIKQLLPGVFQRTLKPKSPLAALLKVMETLHRPSEIVLGSLDELLNPRRTRDNLVPLLARWLDLGFLLDRSGGDKLRAQAQDTISTGLGRLRELIACAPGLSQQTGTKAGLERFLEIATGEKGVRILENKIVTKKPPILEEDRDTEAKPFHITVIVPERLRPHYELIRRIIESEKPAYVTCDIIDSSGAQIGHGENL